jgi:hypothetical protein
VELHLRRLHQADQAVVVEAAAKAAVDHLKIKKLLIGGE